MASARTFITGALALLVAGCVHAEFKPVGLQPIIDLHRHTPWPGDPDDAGLIAIQKAMRQHGAMPHRYLSTARREWRAS